jgi:hypothetical protein
MESNEEFARELRQLLCAGKQLFSRLPDLYERTFTKKIPLKKSTLRSFITAHLNGYSVKSIDGNPGRVWVIKDGLNAETLAELVHAPTSLQQCTLPPTPRPTATQQTAIIADDRFIAELLHLFQTGDDQYWSTLPKRYTTLFPNNLMPYHNKKLRAFIDAKTDYTVESINGNPAHLAVVKKPGARAAALFTSQRNGVTKPQGPAGAKPAGNTVTEESPPIPLLCMAAPSPPAAEGSALPVHTAEPLVRQQRSRTSEVVPVLTKPVQIFSEEKADTPAATSLLSYILAPPAKESPGARAQELLVNGERLTSSCGILGVRSTIGSTKQSGGGDKEEKAPSMPSIASVSDTVYLNTEAPFCAICIGVQGAGKSHTMNVVLENCLLSTVEDYNYPTRPVIRTHQSMAGLVLHFDQSQANMCETVGLVEPTPKLRNIDNTQVSNMVILVSPTFYKQRKAFYEPLNVEVHPLLFDWTTMTAQQLRKLMRLCDTDAQLYVSTMLSTLRDYQRDGHVPVFSSFLKEIEEMCDVANQAAPLRQV